MLQILRWSTAFYQLLNVMAAAADAFNAGMTSLSKVLKGTGIEATKITRLYLYAQDEKKTNNALKKRTNRKKVKTDASITPKRCERDG